MNSQVTRSSFTDATGSYFWMIFILNATDQEFQMNIQIKLDTVKEAELKEVMKADRRTYTQQEIKKLFTDLLHRQYLMG